MATLATRAAYVLFSSFWVLITIGGVVNPGYRQYREFVSSLAATGAEQPLWGLSAMLCLAVANLLLAPLLLRWDRIVGLAVGTAGVGLLVAATARITCPPKAPFCTSTTTDPVLDLTHGAGVLLFAAAILTAAVVATLRILNRAWVGARTLPWIAASVATVALLAHAILTVSGLPQRMLILTYQIWLVVVIAVARDHVRRSDSRIRIRHDLDQGRIAV